MKGANIFNYFCRMQGIISRKITVRGRVQGVFYRKHAQQKAIELEVSGTVQNLKDGSVVVYVTGDEKHVMEFVKWCRVGSPLSHVDEMVTEEMDVKTFDGFKILK